MAAAVVVALGALAGRGLLVAHIRSDESDVGRLAFGSTAPADPPFADFAQARVALGSRCIRVLVATTANQREQGLREVRTLGPYAGMLFAYPGDSSARFTMAETPTPLDITFFSAKGAPVDDVAMVPCPNGTDATCPVYESRHPYRYALERPSGGASTGSGPLGPCAA